MRTGVAGKAAGFTLLETMVVVVVLGFILTGLAQGLHFGLAGWDRQARIINGDAALDATSRVLRTLIAGMAPGSDPRTPEILGAPDRLAFIAEMPDGAPPDLVRLADVVLGKDAGYRIILRWSPHLHARLLQAPTVHETIVLPGVAELRFAYFRAPVTGRAGGWVDRWQDIDPPMLVRVHIGFVDVARHWPDLIVAPMRRRDDD